MYFISSLICSKSSKNMYVKIVHQGGRVEIHDRPILASDLLSRNPKCCVAHPNVFRHPYAVVAPSATLTLGQKYYIVPIHTVTALQLKHSCSQRKLQSNDDHRQKMERSSSYSSWCLVKSNRNNREKRSEGDCRRERVGKRMSLAHFDQWQPGLDSIMEE